MNDATLWERIEFDATTLAEELFVLQKQHSRVVHDRDDALIRTYVSMALSIVERRANINLLPATYQSRGTNVVRALDARLHWWAAWNGWGYLLPFNNVRSLALLDADDNDVTGQWSVAQQEFGANRDAYMLHPSSVSIAPGTVLRVEVGIVEVDTLDPAVLSLVLRIAASLYEFREATSALTEASFAHELSQVWRPTA